MSPLSVLRLGCLTAGLLAIASCATTPKPTPTAQPAPAASAPSATAAPALADDLTHQPGYVKGEFIYLTAPFPSCHASTIAQSRDGLVAAWFGGTAERNPDVCIWVSRYENGAWTPPMEVGNGVGFETNRLPTWNPALYQAPDGPLMLFYKVGPKPAEWWGMLKKSDDGGKTWGDAQRLPWGVLGPVKDKPVQLSDGSLLCPSSTEGDGGWRIHFERTMDLGQHWQIIIPEYYSTNTTGTNIGAIQPTVLFHKDGELQALGRTREGRICEIWSEDNGLTWGALKLIDLPNPNSGIDAVTLKDGTQLLVYNHNPNEKGRSPLNVAVSKDGRNWEAALVLENEVGPQFSYPAVIQTSDGLVHITYTWKRKRIKHMVVDPAKFVTKPIVNGQWPNL